MGDNTRAVDYEVLKNTILNDLYHLIGCSMDKGLYAFKGGYVLSKALPNIRRTGDIDITILNEHTFELATANLRSYLDSLVSNGYIWGYKFKAPKIEGTRNISGGVKLYAKRDENSPKWVLCGIDMSIHPLDNGVELSVDGYPQYTKEHMLSDKVSALYGSERNVLRRIRDVLDIYLILSISNRLDFRLFYCNLRVDYRQLSTFEKLLRSNPKLVLSKLNELLVNGERVSQNVGISCNTVVSVVIRFLTTIRRRQ